MANGNETCLQAPAVMRGTAVSPHAFAPTGPTASTRSSAKPVDMTSWSIPLQAQSWRRHCEHTVLDRSTYSSVHILRRGMPWLLQALEPAGLPHDDVHAYFHEHVRQQELADGVRRHLRKATAKWTAPGTLHVALTRLDHQLQKQAREDVEQADLPAKLRGTKSAAVLSKLCGPRRPVAAPVAAEGAPRSPAWSVVRNSELRQSASMPAMPGFTRALPPADGAGGSLSVTGGGSRGVHNGPLKGSPAPRCCTWGTSAAGSQSGSPGLYQRGPAAQSRGLILPAVQSAAGTVSRRAEVPAHVAAEREMVVALPPCARATAGVQRGIGGPAVPKAAEVPEVPLHPYPRRSALWSNEAGAEAGRPMRHQVMAGGGAASPAHSLPRSPSRFTLAPVSLPVPRRIKQEAQHLSRRPVC